jgi:hypothetical protein
MADLEKIRRIAEALGEERIKFVIRRDEPLEKEERFKIIHEKYGVEIRKGKAFPTSYGELLIDDFINFLEEYDDDFELETTLIDLEAVVINPLYL